MGAFPQAIAFKAAQLGPVNNTTFGVDNPPLTATSSVLEVAVKVNQTSEAGASVDPPGLHPEKEGYGTVEVALTLVPLKLFVTLPPPGQAGGVERFKVVAPEHSSLGGWAKAKVKQLKSIAIVKNDFIYMVLDYADLTAQIN
ncbi:MAG: hypothetical protein DHS20C17_32880 [Cyclobacteriaceae bacterium]|nr:MAG: hypothetical protein DHS20C17_32880 [Cyclobacteriaceae bacterium]